MEKWQQLEYCCPKQIPITFEDDGLTIEVTAWNFAAQFYSLITSHELTSDLSLLDVNKNDPFSKYQSNDNISCFYSGLWYKKAWKHQISPNSNDWLCPIIFACDETLVGSHLGRASMHPLLFTLSIFKQELRNKSIAWRPLGYIHNLKNYGTGVNLGKRPSEFSKVQTS